MKQKRAFRPPGRIPKDAVLLIPEPENDNEIPPYGVKPGYYNSKQMLQLLEDYKKNADAVHFIADMLETGDAENDGFVELLRAGCKNPAEIERVVRICRE